MKKLLSKKELNYLASVEVKAGMMPAEPLAEMAKVLGKGGKLQNNTLYKLLNKLYSPYYKEPLDNYADEEENYSLRDIIDGLEDDNYDTEATILEALERKDKDALKPLVFIWKNQKKEGSLHPYLGYVRSYLGDRRYFINTQKNFNRKIGMCPEIEAVMKLMSQKDRQVIESIIE